MELDEIDYSIKIGNYTFENPVGTASGTFGYGAEYKKLVDLDKIGAIYTKAVTVLPRIGNPTPRLVETPSGLLNAIGLANVGLDDFIKTKIPFLKKCKSAVIVNVAGSEAEDYKKVVQRLDDIDSVNGFEINFSCPNVKKGCLAFGTDSYSVEKLTSELRLLTSKPLIIKLTPNVTDIAQIAKAAENGGADGISCINTLLGMVIDINKKKPVLANGTGGLSGPAIRPVGVAAVYKVSRAVKIPVIGIGGINCGEDAVEYLLAGASAIQVGTGTFANPSLANEVLDFIENYMIQNGISSLHEFKSILD